MSLINDALKRAKAAQKKDEPSTAPPLQFQPVDPSQKGPRGPRWPILLCFAGALIVGGLLLKAVFSKEQPLKVEAKGVAAPTNNAQSTEAAALPPGTGVLPPVPKPTTFQPRTQELAGATSSASVEPARPAAPKLQGILFHPTRPSALINGKTVFVGDKVGDFRVSAIARDSATLVSSTETNVLTFGP
jgi:hypothetical protein